MLDVTTDFTLDTKDYWKDFWKNDILGGGKDPDSSSASLREFHKMLWSKKLPNGEIMDLQKGNGYTYLQWKDFCFGSDSILVTFRYKRNEEFLRTVKDSMPNYHEYIENFLHRAYTIGGLIIFPKMTGSINQSRGCNNQICDRWDLSLECIRRYYNNEDSPLSSCLNRNKAFFDLFVDFKRYVNFFFLQDCVDEYNNVKLWYKTKLFEPNPIPQDIESYQLWNDRQLEFLEKRNNRIREYLSQHA